MKEHQDYIRDIAEMRSMMERSSKFLSLSGWAGIMAGIYALAGAYIAYKVFHFNPDRIVYDTRALPSGLVYVFLVAGAVLVLAIGTAFYVSYRNALRRDEQFWNNTAKRLMINMAVPLIVGGVVIMIVFFQGLIGLIAPFTLIFYGLALYNAGKYTYDEIRSLGLVEIALGLASTWFVEYGLLFWAIGFGIVHIIYGIYMYYRYER